MRKLQEGRENLKSRGAGRNLNRLTSVESNSSLPGQRKFLRPDQIRKKIQVQLVSGLPNQDFGRANNMISAINRSTKVAMQRTEQKNKLPEIKDDLRAPDIMNGAFTTAQKRPAGSSHSPRSPMISNFDPTQAS